MFFVLVLRVVKVLGLAENFLDFVFKDSTALTDFSVSVSSSRYWTLRQDFIELGLESCCACFKFWISKLIVLGVCTVNF